MCERRLWACLYGGLGLCCGAPRGPSRTRALPGGGTRRVPGRARGVSRRGVGSRERRARAVCGAEKVNVNVTRLKT